MVTLQNILFIECSHMLAYIHTICHRTSQHFSICQNGRLCKKWLKIQETIINILNNIQLRILSIIIGL